MAMDQTSKIVLGAIVLGSVGLLAATLAGQNTGSGAKPGDIINEGAQAGSDGKDYQWRVIKSFPGTEQPFTAMVKLAGFGSWGQEAIVAMGETAEQARNGALEYLAQLA
jgi:hypothetical protein